MRKGGPRQGAALKTSQPLLEQATDGSTYSAPAHPGQQHVERRMSIAAQLWAWKQQAGGPTNLLVLLAICDGVNEHHGYTYASADHFAKKCGLNERSIRSAIKRLVDLGLLRVEERPGKTALIFPLFSPVTIFPDTPERGSGVRPPTPERGSGVRPPTPERGSVTPERGSDDPVINLDLSGSKEPSRDAQHASRLPVDWSPDSEQIDFAISLGLPPSVIEQQASRFRDYWVAKAGRDAKKLDWSATWRNWLRNDHQPLERTTHAQPSRLEKTLAASRRGADAAACFLDAGGDIFGGFPR